MRLGNALATLALLLIPAAAEACMANGPDGYATGLVWDSRPENVPLNAYVLKIDAIQTSDDIYGFTARVIDGPAGMQSKRYRFTQLNLNSCVGFGSASGYVVVYKGVVSSVVGGKTVSAIQIIDYSPTMINEIVRYVFGGSQWRYPGEPSQRQAGPF